MRIIKWIKKCPVFLLLVISGLALTLTGAAGRFSIYKDYEFDPIKRPFLALVMEGAGNGTAPWEIAEHIGMGAGEFPGRLGEHGKQSFCLFKILRLFEPEIKRAQL